MVETAGTWLQVNIFTGCRIGWSAVGMTLIRTPAEKLKVVQKHLAEGDRGAEQIFESIGCYLGYSLAYYADFYDIKHLLILGRVTSGRGGSIIQEEAKKVLKGEFPELAKKIQLHLPDESSRRVGQAIAAASLAEIK